LKIGDIVKFDGEPNKLRSWLEQMELAFEVKGVEADKHKVQYGLLGLGDKCALFRRKYRDNFNKGFENFTTWNDFVEQMDLEYADPKEVEEAQQKIETLKQTEKVRTYFRRLEDLNRLAGFDETALQRHSLNGLKDEIKAAILRVPEPASDYPAFKRQAINIGMNLEKHTTSKDQGQERSGKRKRHGGDHGGRAESKKSKSSEGSKKEGQGNSGTSAKDADNKNKKMGPSWAKIPREIREARKRDGACIQCGIVGHFGKECPNPINTSGRKKVAAAAASAKEKQPTEKKASVGVAQIQVTEAPYMVESESDLDIWGRVDGKSSPWPEASKANSTDMEKMQTEGMNLLEGSGFHSSVFALSSCCYSSSVSCCSCYDTRLNVSMVSAQSHDDSPLSKRFKGENVLSFRRKAKLDGRRIIVPAKLDWQSPLGKGTRRVDVKVMIDTGAEISAIDPKFIDACSIPTEKRKVHAKITTADGAIIKGAGQQVVHNCMIRIWALRFCTRVLSDP
jgi:hypothetical protein